MKLDLSANALRLLSEPPERGSTHLWLARVSGVLKAYLKADECAAFLRECCDRFVAHRHIPDREIEAAVEFAYSSDATTKRKSPKWPTQNRKMIESVLDAVEPCFDGITDTGLSAQDVLPALFEPGELVCASVLCERALVRPLESIISAADRMQFVVTNPMRGEHGINLQGKVSPRCLDNVAMRRHLVMEIDDLTLTKAMQATLATALGRYATLVLVVDSAGKSLHCWYRVDHMDADQQARFFAGACLLGADRTRWDASGWLRMPGGLRRCSDGSTKRQRILYFNRNGGCDGRSSYTA